VPADSIIASSDGLPRRRDALMTAGQRLDRARRNTAASWYGDTSTNSVTLKPHRHFCLEYVVGLFDGLTLQPPKGAMRVCAYLGPGR
jgi:hypothetical protein